MFVLNNKQRLITSGKVGCAERSTVALLLGIID